jgi:RNA 2',3'-cyclic 3'-phosphodiesterase
MSGSIGISTDPLPPLIRAFVAVRLPEETVARLAEFQMKLRPLFREASWTRPEAMHLTLRFLGNIESARVNDLTAELLVATRLKAPFSLELGAIGQFGNRVLWVGVQSGSEPLARLAEVVREACAGYGAHEEERAFHPHVTLARLRRPERGAGARLREVKAPSFATWQVNDVELIRSELSPRGSRYTTLAMVPLDNELAGGTPASL